MKRKKKNKRNKQHNSLAKEIKISKKQQSQREQHKNNEQLTLFGRLVKVISQLKKQWHLLIAALAINLGFLFNHYNKMPLFWLKGLFGFALYIVLSFAIIYIENKNKALEIELTGDPQLVKCNVKYRERINSNSNFILCLIACFYFIIISVILGFVKINPIGIYSLLSLFCVVFFAFVVFQYYIFILLLLRDIAKISPERYYELIPERTEWFNLLQTFSNGCRNIFIVLGSLFILLFILFSPVNSIQIIFKEGFTSAKFLPLLITWIIILIAIIFMVPFSSLARSFLLNKIHNNLISQSIKNYNILYNTSEGEVKMAYMNIILRLNDHKFVLQGSFSWFLPLVVSITNFVSLIASILADLKDINILT